MEAWEVDVLVGGGFSAAPLRGAMPVELGLLDLGVELFLFLDKD